MKRRTCIATALAMAGATLVHAADAPPIELHLDLAVDPAKEKELLHFFETSFRPAAAQQPGYISLKLLKLVSTLRGPAPAGANYRFALSFATEELRQKWVASAAHQKLWPVMESMLTDKQYTRLLYETH